MTENRTRDVRGRRGSSVARPEFSHPRLRMSRESDALHILLPVKSGKYRRLLDLIWVCVWLAIEVVLVVTLAGRPLVPGPFPALVGLTIAFTLAGFFLTYRWLWYWTGKERFVVRAEGMAASREILGFGRTRTFAKDQIRSIRGRRLQYRVVYPTWGRMFIGTGNGEIVIEADEESHAYGKGLELDEARGLAELLTQELDPRPVERRPTEFRLG
jgi:hypothetical protein